LKQQLERGLKKKQCRSNNNHQAQAGHTNWCSNFRSCCFCGDL